ncbi:arylsulfatase [Rubripirellula amarantea]|nr:arylsulfatase [Rubripirellula amarantea]
MKTLFALLCIYSLSVGLVVADETQPANVIFILCDDLGWGDLGILHQNSDPNHKDFATPRLDRMAAEGVQVRSHYCAAPVCAPARASLLTGVHQGHAEIRDNQFDKALEDNHTLGTVMQSAGYRTALIGKYGLQGPGDSAMNWPAYPTKRGFDEFYGYVRHVDGHIHYPAHDWPLGNGENHQTPKEVWHNNEEVSASLKGCYTTDLFTAKAKDFVISQHSTQPDQPFFLFLAYDTPHAALQVPSMEYPEGTGVKGGIQWLGKPGQMINTATGTIDSYYHPECSDPSWTNVEQRFATMVRRIDDCVGDLLDTLTELGIAEDTLVVLSSDNGPHEESYLEGIRYSPDSFDSFGPFDGIKRDVWEGGIRVPTLAWWPSKIAPGQIDDQPSQFHDWMPTLADIAGQAAPARTDGVSLLPRWTQGSGKPSTIYVEYLNRGKTPNYESFPEWKRNQRRGQMQAMQIEGNSAVRFNITKPSSDFMLFDRENDPTQQTNIASQMPATSKKLRNQVARMRRPNESAPRPYDQIAVPGYKADRSSTKGNGAVKIQFLPGAFEYVPHPSIFEGITRVRTPRLGELAESSPSERGAAVWTQDIQIDQPGHYTFTLQSDVKSFVRLHDIALLDADFGYDGSTTRSETIKLGVGTHPLTCIALVEGDQAPQIKLEFNRTSDKK